MSDTDKSDNTPAYAFTLQQRRKIMLALLDFLRANGGNGTTEGNSLGETIVKLEVILHE